MTSVADDLNLKKGYEDISKEIRIIKDIMSGGVDLNEKVNLKDAPFSSYIDLERIVHLQNIIKGLGGYFPVYVTGKFEIANGFRGFTMKMIVKLLKKIARDYSLRAIVGMCKEHYDWIVQNVFQNLRLVIGLPFNPIQPVSPKILINSLTTSASFQKDTVYHTLFLNPKNDRGITKLTVKVEHIGGNFSFVGVASAKSLTLLRDNWIGGQYGGACYYSDPEFVCVYTKFKRTSFIDSSFKVGDGDVLSAEVDQSCRTIVFLHSGTLLPYYVVNLPEETYFGYSGSRMGGVTISFLSLQRLIKPTIAPEDFDATAVQWSM